MYEQDGYFDPNTITQGSVADATPPPIMVAPNNTNNFEENLFYQPHDPPCPDDVSALTTMEITHQHHLGFNMENENSINNIVNNNIMDSHSVQEVIDVVPYDYDQSNWGVEEFQEKGYGVNHQQHERQPNDQLFQKIETQNCSQSYNSSSILDPSYPSPDLLNLLHLPRRSNFQNSMGFFGDFSIGAESTTASSVLYDPLLHLNLPPQPPTFRELFQSLPRGYSLPTSRNGSSLFGGSGDDIDANGVGYQDGDNEVLEFNRGMACVAKGREGKGTKPFATEKQRREQLNDKYKILRSLIPKPTKTDRASVVGDAIDYIRELLRTVSELKLLVEKKRYGKDMSKKRKTEDDGSIGNFGVPDYGGFLVGSVVYPEKGSHGCKPFEDDKPFRSSHPTILLLDRGECYFALKVWHAQLAGAAAVLVADSIDEPLITMDSPEESTDADGYIEKIGIPSALIEKSFGDSLKEALNNKDEQVLVRIEWRESMRLPDNRVEYEFWTNSNDECGARCDEQMNFVKNFKGHAQILERGGYTLFTPHYITWYCPQAFILTRQCKSQCINRGRYCAPDPEKDFGEGYEGKDVVYENLRQLCVHRVSKESNRSWVWWDYVTDFHVRCSMKEKRYSKECAEDVMKSLDLPIEKIKKCLGDHEADVKNEVLKTEQQVQIGRGSRGDVTILPTLVINNVQYRGKLERTAVLKAVCAGFKQSTEPSVCLTVDLETNECLERNGGCWQDRANNITACKDTFRGRVSKCPVVNSVQYKADDYTSCEAFGPARCSINHGGCWSETRNGLTFSACSESTVDGCRCPAGFQGDGHKCEDVDECKERSACQCDGCSCKNTWGSYECKRSGDLLYLKEQDVCIERSGSRFGKVLAFVLLAVVVGAGLAGYVFYKYRLQSYMDSEIMSIMSQYMPLDDQNNEVHTAEAQPLLQSSV